MTNGTRETPWKNKPNFDVTGARARGTHGRDAHATERLAASPRLRGDDIATDRASAPNKPNLREGDLEDKCRVNKELRPMGCTSGPEKQSQFGQGGGYRGQGSAARPRCPKSGPVVQTDPVPALVPIGRSAFLGGRIVQNEPNFEPGGLREAPSIGHSIIPPFQSDAHRAKQSQFRGHGRRRPGYSWARRPCCGTPGGVSPPARG